MSFITHDFRCTTCGIIEERMVRRSEVDSQVCNCSTQTMKRLPSGPITTFKFGDRAAIKSKKVVSFRD